jgi:hypothetical protein
MAIEDAKNPMQGVSGPGPYAKRTDLSYQSQSYGDGAAYDAAKSGAPLAKAPKNPKLSEAPRVSNPPVGLYDPTQRPDEPVTSGIDRGAGVGSDALMMRQPDDANFRANIAAYMPVLTYVASLPNASPETRAAIRQLRDYA